VFARFRSLAGPPKGRNVLEPTRPFLRVRKVLGILTEDFRLYHDLVAALKAKDVPFASLSFQDEIPREVGAILTSPAEAPRVRFAAVVAVDVLGEAIAKGLAIVRGHRQWRELVVGVDPGAEPGVAILGDGEIIDTREAANPEAVEGVVRAAMLAFPSDRVRLRVGHGDPTNRNRIINALSPLGLPVEIVDEKGTTHRSHTPDADAAVEIARGRGVRAARFYAVEPTPGEVRETQRQSRLKSDGIVTISKALARRVAKGELTLAEAIERHRQKPRAGTA